MVRLRQVRTHWSAVAEMSDPVRYRTSFKQLKDFIRVKKVSLRDWNKETLGVDVGDTTCVLYDPELRKSKP
jgi:hypothetical protein